MSVERYNRRCACGRMVKADATECAEGKGCKTSLNLSKEARAKISQKLRAYHANVRALNLPEPNRKKCPNCKKWRKVPGEYTVRSRTLVDGTVVKRPEGRCRFCNKKAAKKRRDKQSKEERQAERRRWRKTRDNESHRRYQREWVRAKKIRLGLPVREPRIKAPVEPTFVDPALFFEWAHWIKPQYTDAEARAKSRAENGETPGLEVKYIDAIMGRYGATDQFNIFYPPDPL